MAVAAAERRSFSGSCILPTMESPRLSGLELLRSGRSMVCSLRGERGGDACLGAEPSWEADRRSDGSSSSEESYSKTACSPSPTASWLCESLFKN